MNVTYRVFREENGQYTFREVFAEHDGQIISYSRNAVIAIGESVDALAREVEWLQEALAQPVLTVAEMEKAIAAKNPGQQSARKTISHAELWAKLGLEREEDQDVAEFPLPIHAN